jgi:transcriptional regulator with XRE-family HTH domain
MNYRKPQHFLYLKRKQLKLTQRQLSEKSGISVQSIVALENSKNKCDRMYLGTAIKLTTALNSNLNELECYLNGELDL